MLKSSGLKFLFADEFLDILCSFRVLRVGGRFGGGKTSFAVLVAAWLLASQRVDRVVSNVPNVFNSAPTIPLYNSAIVLDEAWQYLETRQDVLSYAAFLRKFNLFLILPTIFPIHRRLDFFSVVRIFNGYSMGVPAWLYRWSLSMEKSKREVGYFAVWKPTELFGLFDTEFVPGDDAGISDALAETSRKRGFKGKAGKYAQVQELQEALGDIGKGNRASALQYAIIQNQISEAVEELGDAAHDFDDANAELQSVSRKLRR